MTSKSFLPPLLQSAPVAIASLDRQGRIVAVNRALLEASGCSEEELAGQAFSIFLATVDDAAAAEAALAQVACGARETYRTPGSHRARSGGTLDLDIVVSVVRDGDGAAQGALALLQDVTWHARTAREAARRAADLRDAERALQLSEARYRALFEQAPLSVQILSPEGRTLQVNAAWERLWGITLDQLSDYNLLEDPQLVARGLMPFIRQAFAGEPTHVPAALYDPDETLPDRSTNENAGRWVRAVAYPVKNADGSLREVVLIHEDITEQVLAQDERRHATELLQLVVQQSGEAIVVADAEGVLRVFNEAAERLHGVRGGETPAAQWAERYSLYTLDGAPLPYAETALYRALRGATVRDARWVVRPMDGSVRTLVGSATPLTHADGKPAGAVLIARDDTERLAAEEERERLLIEARDAHRAIEAASRLKDAFLATLSHELRTPLNAILGWVRILRDRDFDSSTRHALAVIERNAGAQTRLVDDLLDMSRIITGKLRLQLQPVDFGAITAAALETLKPAADAKGVSLEATVEEGVPTFSGDPDRLQQVLWNLVSNAVKFTGAGGRVSIVVAGEPHRIRITVADTGCGIAADVLPAVFDRFVQGDSSSTRAHAGLGLGLAIVRHLVELHGGTVSGESQGPGTGATFRVWLPIRPAVGNESPARPA